MGSLEGLTPGKRIESYLGRRSQVIKACIVLTAKLFFADPQWIVPSIIAPFIFTLVAFFLFGGQAAGGGPILNDTWFYSDGTWSRHASSYGPPPFENGSGADDPLLGGVFLVGSSDGSRSETWSYVNGSWSEYAIGGSNPPPRHGATLAFDPSGASIFCGGTDPSGSRWLDDCWTWGVAYIPPKAVQNASPFSSLVVDAAIGAILVPLAIAVYWSTRPKRPDITRVPTPSPTGSGTG